MPKTEPDQVVDQVEETTYTKGKRSRKMIPRPTPAKLEPPAKPSKAARYPSDNPED